MAYLSGDPRRAIAALEKALSIEPDNALFKANLERLKRPPSPRLVTLGRAGLQSAALGLAVFVLYALGACRTIYVGDSGELVAAVHTLGIPHPSGYPLYVLLGKLWTLLVPVRLVAFRMSLFSAACAAVAVALLHRLGRAARAAAARPPPPRALLLAVSPSFWGEANVQRVYTLNAVFVVLAATAAVALARVAARPRICSLAAFLCGLGATNHTFMALMAVAIGLFARRRPSPSLVRGVRGSSSPARRCFAAGLLPYAYLPLRSRMDPAARLGQPRDARPRSATWCTRRDFWGRAWIEGPSDLAGHASRTTRRSLADGAGLGGGGRWPLVGDVPARRRWPVLLPAPRDGA